MELRASMVRRIVESELDDEKKLLLVVVVETYFPLDAEQRDTYRRLLARKEFQKVQELELTWADKLMQQGLLKGKRDTLVQLLTTKFGSLPKEIASRVESLESVEELDGHLGRVLTARTLEEMGI